MRICVIYGGTSAEAEVSRKSGKAIAEALRKKGHSVEELDIPESEVLQRLDELRKFDVVFVGYHGGAGEDGHVQAVLELAGIKFTGSGATASALGMNKILTKRLFEQAGIPTAPWVVVDGAPSVDEVLLSMARAGFALPAVVKPADQGSTVGVTIAVSERSLVEGIKKAQNYSKAVLVEKYIPGREMTVAVLDGKPLPVVEIIPEGGFYDYEHKYTHGKSSYVCPAQIPEPISNALKHVGVRAYETLQCRHYARVDFRLSEDGEVFCLEVNTLPGMTDLSLVPMAARQAGIDFPELVHRIAEMAYNS